MSRLFNSLHVISLCSLAISQIQAAPTPQHCTISWHTLPENLSMRTASKEWNGFRDLFFHRKNGKLLANLHDNKSGKNAIGYYDWDNNQFSFINPMNSDTASATILAADVDGNLICYLPDTLYKFFVINTPDGLWREFDNDNFMGNLGWDSLHCPGGHCYSFIKGKGNEQLWEYQLLRKRKDVSSAYTPPSATVVGGGWYANYQNGRYHWDLFSYQGVALTKPPYKSGVWGLQFRAMPNEQTVLMDACQSDGYCGAFILEHKHEYGTHFLGTNNTASASAIIAATGNVTAPGFMYLNKTDDSIYELPLNQFRNPLPQGTLRYYNADSSATKARQFDCFYYSLPDKGITFRNCNRVQKESWIGLPSASGNHAPGEIYNIRYFLEASGAAGQLQGVDNVQINDIQVDENEHIFIYGRGQREQSAAVQMFRAECLPQHNANSAF